MNPIKLTIRRLMMSRYGTLNENMEKWAEGMTFIPKDDVKKASIRWQEADSEPDNQTRFEEFTGVKVERLGRGQNFFLTVKDDTERKIEAINGPNGYTLIKAHVARSKGC